MTDGAHYMFDMYDMWYFGELAKICTYGFQFMFQILLVPRGRTWDDCVAHTTLFCFFYDSDVLGYYLTHYDFHYGFMILIRLMGYLI